MIVAPTTTPTGFVLSVADKLAEIAATARDVDRTHAGGLRPDSSLAWIARYVKADADRAATRDTDMKFHHPQDRPVTDPAYRSLFLACGGANRYEPGHWQLRLLRDLAADFGGYTDPRTALAELACAAIRDRERDVQAAERAVATEHDALQARVEAAEALQGPLEQAQARVRALAEENATLRATLDQTAAELAAEHKRVKTLWSKIDAARDGDGDDAPKVPKDSRVRRTKVDGEVGIYRTSGGALEIGYRDADDKQRWEIVADDDLDVARALRAERLAEAKSAAVTS